MSFPSTSTRRHARGFTLVELLVVIGIIALLMSILLPTLGRVREQAQRTKCMSQVREIGRALFSYQNANNGFYPFTNWDGGKSSTVQFKMGWLYATKPNPPKFLDPKEVEEGAFYPYIGNVGIYHCPAHDSASFLGSATSETLTSYLMNGALSNYAAVANKHYKFNQFLSWQDGIFLWEGDERTSSPWNDGSSSPWESFDPAAATKEGFTSRHGKGSCGARLDGGVEYYNQQEYFAWAKEAQTRQGEVNFQNRLFFRPK